MKKQQKVQDKGEEERGGGEGEFDVKMENGERPRHDMRWDEMR
jgi:hypothetical protein